VNYTDKQFIAMPDFLNLKHQNLKYLDALTYLAIRSFDGDENEYCWPSYEKIMERSGLGRTFISESIKRLEAAGFFVKIERSKREGTCNRYYFGELDHFEQLSYDVLFKTDDLTNHERAMLICLRQFFVHGTLQCAYSTKEFAQQLGVSYKQVYNPLKGLIDKGYIKETSVLYKSSSKAKVYFFLTDNIKWPLPQNTIGVTKESVLKIKVA
jgi:DNA-binding MarR family transcriptional regulator